MGRVNSAESDDARVWAPYGHVSDAGHPYESYESSHDDYVSNSSHASHASHTSHTSTYSFGRGGGGEYDADRDGSSFSLPIGFGSSIWGPAPLERAPHTHGVPALTVFASGGSSKADDVDTPLGQRQATRLERGVELLLCTPPESPACDAAPVLGLPPLPPAHTAHILPTVEHAGDALYTAASAWWSMDHGGDEGRREGERGEGKEEWRAIGGDADVSDGDDDVELDESYEGDAVEHDACFRGGGVRSERAWGGGGGMA